MIKRKFGMRTLNISQGRYGSYSHKYLNAYDLTGEDSGIDKFKTYYPFIITGVFTLSGTGFANTVLFYDAENDVTLALTHQNKLDLSVYKIGKRFNIGDVIYYEGTAGKATGNHIHLEIGKGKQTKKVKIGGVWQLQNLINIEDYFYLDETNIIKKKLYDFEIRTHYEKVGDDMVKIIPGYQKIEWKGYEIHLYKQQNNQCLGMIGAGSSNSFKDIKDIDDNRVHFCKVNANYFEMSDKSIFGQHYGVEQNPQIDLAPKQKEWLVLWLDKNNEIHYDLSSNYWLDKNDVQFACSPALVILHEGKDTNAVSSASKKTINTVTTQTCLVQFKDKTFGLIVFNSKISLLKVREFVKEIGCIHCSAYDSGESSQMVVNGEYKVHTGRKIANVLTLCSTVVPNTENTPPKIVTITIQQEEYETLKNKAGKYDEILKIIGGK